MITTVGIDPKQNCAMLPITVDFTENPTDGKHRLKYAFLSTPSVRGV